MGARVKNRLNETSFKALLRAKAKPGRHCDGQGLYLSVGPGEARRWVFLFRWQGRTREMGLGSAAKIGLADARNLAAAADRLVGLGEDPIAKKHAIAERPCFGPFAKATIVTMASGFRNPKHVKQWEKTLLVDAKPLASQRVDHITSEDIRNLLLPMWTEKQETASRLRGRIERVLDAAIALGHRAGPNPARWKGAMKDLLPKRSKLARGHFTALPYAETPAFFHDLRKREGTSARALEFLVLTLARSGEVRGAVWREIDLKAAVWTIPDFRTKTGKEHRVPLTARAVKILRDVMPLTGGKPDAPLFPGLRNKPLSDASLSAVLRRMGVPKERATVHGFRSTFRDWVFEETDFPREIAEMSLAHVVGDATERAYRRGDALQKRRELIDTWANHLSGNSVS